MHIPVLSQTCNLFHPYISDVLCWVLRGLGFCLSYDCETERGKGSPVNHEADSNDRWVILHLQALRVVCQSLEKCIADSGRKWEHLENTSNTFGTLENPKQITKYAHFCGIRVEMKDNTAKLYGPKSMAHYSCRLWKTRGWSSQCTGFVLMLTPEELWNF